ncbi:MAG: squalene/phytoene synthase family protein [Anaerolineae bacterium]
MLPSPASSITKAASKQTYYTIRFLVDRARVDDAYRAYGYFRWVDDVLDADSGSGAERRAFLERQKSLLEKCYRGEAPRDANLQERMLVELVQRDHEKNSGLQAYLRNMMLVLDFDARRRGRLISQVELNEYTRWLATSVTEALHYFIGHGQASPQNGTRYLAVTGAHITHMLRDTLEDIQAGYFNIPREYLAAKGIGPKDVESDPYRAWIQERANLARVCFKSGKDYLAQVENIRCRIAGYAYIARFERVLEAIERLDYRLAPEYPQGRGLGAGMRMTGSVLSLAFLPVMRK